MNQKENKTMNFFKITIILSLITFSTIISAQENNTFVLETKKANHQKSTSSKEENVRNFQQFGIMSRTHENFKKKYGVQVLYENCVITAYMSEKVKKNNQDVAQSLTEKYGNIWRKDLGFVPYGL